MINSSFDSELLFIKKRNPSSPYASEEPLRIHNKLRKISSCFKDGSKIGKILKTWLVKSRSSVELFNLVRLAIHHKRKVQCDNCSSKILLRAVCASPILKIFDRFLLETETSYEDYDPVKFKIYFMEHADIFTLCSNCEK